MTGVLTPWNHLDLQLPRRHVQLNNLIKSIIAYIYIRGNITGQSFSYLCKPVKQSISFSPWNNCGADLQQRTTIHFVSFLEKKQGTDGKKLIIPGFNMRGTVTARTMKNPMHIIILGQEGVGKSGERIPLALPPSRPPTLPPDPLHSLPPDLTPSLQTCTCTLLKK